MADAIMLSPETYDRLKRLLDDWDNGFEKTLKLGKGLQVEERGTDYVKIGINKNDVPIPGGGPVSTIDVDICVDGSPETHTFVIADSS